MDFRLSGKNKGERQRLLTVEDENYTVRPGRGLSVLSAMLYIIGLFGVFPILVLPRAVVDCGWVGFLLLIAVWIIETYTAVILGRCWLLAEKLNPFIVSQSRYPYPTVAEQALGPRARTVVSVLLNMAIFGAGVPFLVVAAQNLQLTVEKATGDRAPLSFCYWMIILAVVLCPFKWLGSPKDLKLVTTASVVSMFLVSALTWLAMVENMSQVEPTQPASLSWGAVALAYGNLSFVCDVHPVILTVQMDMEDKRKLGKAVILGFTVSGLLFMATAAGAFLVYGAKTHPNLLTNLPASTPLYMDMVLVTVQICLCFVMGSNTLFQDVEDLLGIPREFNWRRCVVRSLILFATLLVGESVPDFGAIMSLVGGVLAGPLMLIFPPLFYIKLKDRDTLNPMGWFEKMLNSEIILAGVLGTLVAIYSSVRTFVARQEGLAPPCFVNTTFLFLNNEEGL